MILQSARSTSGRKSSGRKNDRKKLMREEVRLTQFVICVILFLVMFVGKGVFPDRINQVEEEFLRMLSMDTDFRGAFSALGESLAQKKSVLGELGSLCVEVFGGEEEKTISVFNNMETQLEKEQSFLNSNPNHAEFTAHLFRMEEIPEEWFAVEVVEEAESEVEVMPTVGTVLLEADYKGPELPEGYTMDQISLGALETVTPVMGTLWSEYGYRDHPIDGMHKFHNGVDLGAGQGEAIGAFAAGTVEYIGENDIYGLYLQIDHGNGIKSFYAHCSKLCVGQGQLVKAGEKVAEVGETGSATGPHLHFELKYEGTHIDPAYYITYTLPK